MTWCMRPADSTCVDVVDVVDAVDPPRKRSEEEEAELGGEVTALLVLFVQTAVWKGKAKRRRCMRNWAWWMTTPRLSWGEVGW